MNFTLTGSGSSFEMERSAWVAWPLTSLMPKISEDGNEVEIFTAMLPDVDGFSTSSSGYIDVSNWLFAGRNNSHRLERMH